MIVQLGSNIISGVYTVFEVVVAVVLARLLTSLTGTLNVKAIYEDRRKISLTTSKIPAISDHGLTVPRVHFATALTSVIMTVLLTAVQFGIVGVSEKEYEEVTVKYLVNKAPPGYLLNVEDHVSMERKKVSKELILLTQYHYCIRKMNTFSEFYAYIYDGDDIEEPAHNPSRKLDTPCVTNEFGFEKKVTHTTWDTNASALVTDLQQCKIKFRFFDLELNKVMKAHVETGCQWTVREAWCFTDTTSYCAAMLEYSGRYILLTAANEGMHLMSIPSYEAFGSEKLKLSPLLLALQVVRDPKGLIRFFSSRVERNATVRKITNPARQATRIHVPLLTAALVPSLAILLLTACTTLYLWRKVIFIPGRQGYNRFNSAADMLSCAAVEKFRDGGCRFLRSARISVDPDDCGEYASPVKLDDDYAKGKH